MLLQALPNIGNGYYLCSSVVFCKMGDLLFLFSVEGKGKEGMVRGGGCPLREPKKWRGGGCLSW